MFLGDDGVMDGIVEMWRIHVECWLEWEVGVVDPVLDGVSQQEVTKTIDIIGETYGFAKCSHGLFGVGIAGTP